MNRLDKISHFLSYTDFVPFISIPSGIVHLICAIRDSVFPQPAFVPPAEETLLQLSKRKLENWSHLSKGILTLIPIIGNAILFVKWAQNAVALKVLTHYQCYGPLNRLKWLPNLLVQDADFIKKLPSINYNNVQDHDIRFIHSSVNDCLFSSTSAVNKANIEVVEDLINHDIITHHSYFQIDGAIRNDPRIAAAYEAQAVKFETINNPGQHVHIGGAHIFYYYESLPISLKNNVTIITMLATWLLHENPLNVHILRTKIPDQNIYKNIPILLSSAIELGQISFLDLPTAQQTPESACVALRSSSSNNLKQFEDWFNEFSDGLRENEQVLQAYREKRERILVQMVILGEISFEDLPENLKTEKNAIHSLRVNFNQWKNFTDALKQKLEANPEFQTLRQDHSTRQVSGG